MSTQQAAVGSGAGQQQQDKRIKEKDKAPWGDDLTTIKDKKHYDLHL